MQPLAQQSGDYAIPYRNNFAFLLDVDGTLLEIAEQPDAVIVPSYLPSLLQELAELHDGALALVSGRSIATLDRLFAPYHFAAAGQHGAEWRDAQGKHYQLDFPKEILTDLRHRFQSFVQDHPGVVFEDKGISLALHYRLAPLYAQTIQTLMHQAWQLYPDFCVLQQGKRVVEIKPKDANKAEGIQRLMNTTPFNGKIPLFAGDDRTDEDGFEFVQTLNGVCIKIREGETIAPYRLPNVGALLQQLQSYKSLRRIKA